MIDKNILATGKRILAGICMVAAMLGPVCGGGALSIYAASGEESVATPSSVVEERALKMDTKSYVFSNSTDGMFRISFAEGKSYYIGSAVDDDTMVTYALIRYNSKFYLIAADDSEDNVEYNGSYTDTSFDMLASRNYNSTDRWVDISLKKGSTIELSRFTYNKDYSVSLTGYYEGLYYEAGKEATGIFRRDGYYDYFVGGKAVTGDGWYKYGSSSPSGDLVDSDIFDSLGNASVKYLQIFEGHVVSTYNGEKFYSYSRTTKTAVKNKEVLVKNIYVAYDSKGNAVTGMVRKDNDVYYYEAGIPVKNVLRQDGKEYYYFGEDGKAVRSQWVKTGDYQFYFSDKCYAVKVYYDESFPNTDYAGKLFHYSSGKWVSSGTGIVNVNNTYYYFVNGKKYNGTKWYVNSANARYYIKSGVVTYLVKPHGIRYRCLKALSEGGWTAAASVWIPSYNNVAIHTDKAGLADALYYKKAHTVSGYADTYRVYVNNCWVTKKNALLYVPGGYYYFSPTGKMVREKGWRTLSSTSAVYVGDSGNVTEYVRYDAAKGYSIYKSGKLLNQYSEGIKRAVINKKAVYYYSDATGKCVSSDKKVVDDVEYTFDKYGRCFKTESISWNYDAWMKRVTKAYLGKTGIYCNVFVARALRYAGGSDATVDMSVKYTSYSKGGFIINSSNMCSDWALRKVTASGVLSQNGSWQASDEYELTADRENFSYSALVPGDIIVYYTNGEPTHVGIYFGKFSSASELKQYLRKLGISSAACEAYVHDWGSNSGNKPQYWVIQGGMGSSDQVYISNSAYDLSGQYAKKIIHVRH